MWVFPCTCSSQLGGTQPLDRKSHFGDVECPKHGHGARLGSRHASQFTDCSVACPAAENAKRNLRPPKNSIWTVFPLKSLISDVTIGYQSCRLGAKAANMKERVVLDNRVPTQPRAADVCPWSGINSCNSVKYKFVSSVRAQARAQAQASSRAPSCCLI